MSVVWSGRIQTSVTAMEMQKRGNQNEDLGGRRREGRGLQ